MTLRVRAPRPVEKAVPEEPAGPQLPVLEAPADGVPPVTDTPAAYADVRARLLAGRGPLALDTERAQGFRYTAKAYLIQLRRDGAGTVLLDPVAFENGHVRADLSDLADSLADVEWLLHAASQDLPCLAEVGLLPRNLFDTELAARLLGMPKVNLSTVMEAALGVGLRKAHSADDWSKRPLPDEWLAYAALDVERLADVRDWLDDRLRAAGKRDWAAQEFAYLVEHAADPVPTRPDPWRHTSGLHAVRSRRGLEVVRQLWLARDAIAAEIDRAPGRVLIDKAISGVAALFQDETPIVDSALLRQVEGFSRRVAKQYRTVWLDSLRRAANCPAARLPAKSQQPDGPPHPRAWEGLRPDAFARWNRVRPAVIERAEALDLPVENLIAPSALRALLWDGPARVTPSDIDQRLAALGAREWQRELVIPVILAAW